MSFLVMNVWRVGTPLVVLSFFDRYLASILEVDEDDKDLLVHFEGWNQRYDEWIDFGSDRLRPLTPTTAQQFSTAKWVSVTSKSNLSILHTSMINSCYLKYAYFLM